MVARERTKPSESRVACSSGGIADLTLAASVPSAFAAPNLTLLEGSLSNLSSSGTTRTGSAPDAASDFAAPTLVESISLIASLLFRKATPSPRFLLEYYSFGRKNNENL